MVQAAGAGQPGGAVMACGQAGPLPFFLSQM